MPAGSTLPRNPKLIRDRIICGTPKSGPRAASVPIDTLPRPVPSTIAAVAAQKDSPKNQTPITPTKIVANSMFGDIHVQNCCNGVPCRSDSGMNPAPPGSMAATLLPYVPSLTSAVTVAVAVASGSDIRGSPL